MNQRLRPLTNSYFILSLVILLTNDFLLKYEFHNWVTGKLSDFAGLFVFTFFWTTVFPRQKRTVYILTGMMFVYWKSPYSQPLIDVFSENIFPIDRTIDMSDLIALMVLPIAYSIDQVGQLKFKFASVPIALLTIFSFCATSVPLPFQAFDRPEYVLFKTSDIQDVDHFPTEIKVYDFYNMQVVAVTKIQIEKFPRRNDEFQKSQALADLDLRVLYVTKGHYGNDMDLPSYIPLRDSLTIPGNTSITLHLDSVSDELNFSGTRLHGIYRRYSKEKDLLIDGRYKNGIPDSTWSFHNNDKQVITRRHFVEGEVTMIERIQDGTTVSKDVSTRSDVITRQYVILALIGVLSILIVVKLFLNFRASENRIAEPSITTKVIQIVFLPTWIFAIGKVISGFISHPDSDPNIFKFIVQFVLTNAALIPLLAVVHYAIRLRSRFDLVLYILLFVLAFIWIEQYQYLKQIVL